MRIAVDDASIDVATSGKGEAIVLIHGFPMTREIWSAQTAALQKKYLVICPDLRGMGRSQVWEGPYLMETLAADVAAVLDALGIDRAALVGHSMGGYVAMAFCRMYTERVTKLALVCSRLAADSESAARERNDLAERAERTASIEPVVEAYVPRMLAPEASATARNSAYAIARQNDPRGAAALLRGAAQRVESWDIARDLQMPVLVVAGARDSIVNLEEAHAVCAAFSHGALEVFERSGHLPMLEEPQALARCLVEFAGRPAEQIHDEEHAEDDGCRDNRRNQQRQNEMQNCQDHEHDGNEHDEA